MRKARARLELIVLHPAASAEDHHCALRKIVARPGADPKPALDAVTELRGAGVEISVDGYSSGLSSLSYLHTIPAQQLKIDKMLMPGMTSSGSDALPVKPTIDLPYSLAMKIAAQGVDTSHRYHVARPMPLDELLKREASPPEQRATPALKELAWNRPSASAFTSSAPQ